MYTGWDEIFSGVYCSDVEKIVSSLFRNKGLGLDKIPTRVIMIKDFVPVIITIPSIYCCYYKFLFYDQHLTYPRSVTKKGGFEEPGNNRPISLLPILSKVCEKVALRVSEHAILKTNKRVAVEQSRKKWHSTETSFIVSMDTILSLEVVDKRKLTAILFICI